MSFDVFLNICFKENKVQCPPLSIQPFGIETLTGYMIFLFPPSLHPVILHSLCKVPSGINIPVTLKGTGGSLVQVHV